MKLIQFNPELQRNIWENITPTKLIVMPIVLFLIFLLAGSAVNIGITALIMFYIITVMVGAYLAGEEVPNEIQERTWDWQRMSAMTPWQITIGKLLGSTIYQWYSGFICILAFVYSAITIKIDFFVALQMIISMILVATFFQSFSMVLGINAREMPIRIRRFLIIAILLGLAMLLISIFTIMSIADYFERRIHPEEWIEPKIQWFFIKLPVITHFMIGLIFLNFWSLIGLYRSFRTEMYYFNGPEFFTSFLIMTPFYFSGYLFNIPDITLFAYLTLLFTGITIFAYQTALLTAFIDKMEIITFRRLFFYLEQKNWKKVGYDLPLWLIALSIEIISSLVALVFFFISSVELGKIDEAFSQKILFFLLVGCLFVVRDIGIFMYNNFTQGKNAIGLTLTYLFILYYVFPGVLSLSGNEHLIPAFYPFSFNSDFQITATNTIIPLIQTIIVILMVRNAWIIKNQKLEASIQTNEIKK